MQCCMGAFIKNTGYGMGLCSHEDSFCCWDDKTFVCEEFASSLGGQQPFLLYPRDAVPVNLCISTWHEEQTQSAQVGGDLYSTFSLQPAVPPGGITSLQWKNTGSGQDTLPAVSLSHEKPWEFAYPQISLFILSHFPAQPSQQLFLSAPPAFSSSGRNGSLSQTPENTPL